MRRLAAAVIVLGAGLTACRHVVPPAAMPAPEIWFSLEASGPIANTAALPLSGVQIPLAASPALTSADFESVDIAQAAIGPCLVFAIAPDAKHRWQELATTARGRRLVLLFNGRALGARRLDGASNEMRIFMFVEMRESELPALVAELKASVAASKASRRRP